MSTQIATATDVSVPAPAPRGVKRGDRQSRHLAQSVILEEAGSSALIRTAMFTICVVIMLFIGWAAVTQVDEIAVASGSVVPTGQMQVIQHLEGGVIREIRVNDGDLVEAGQILLRLDPAAAMSELEQTRARYAALLLRAERQRSFGLGNKPNFGIVGPEYSALARDQAAIYASQETALEDSRKVLRQQLEQRRSELNTLREQETTLKEHVSLLDEEFKMREKLYNEGLTSKIVYLDLKRQLNQARGDLAARASDRKRTEQSLSEVRARLTELESNQRQAALADMGAVGGEIAQVREALLKLEDRVRRLEVKAPVRGIVKGLSAHTPGGVLVPGSVLLEIVPLDKELVVEGRITTRDIGHVNIGQPVRVKVVTYDYARYGGITGELKDISASTFLDEKGEPFYKGIIKLDRGYVGYDPERNRVLPGMTVQADIQTGKKTLLEYLLKPVYSSINQAFRER